MSTYYVNSSTGNDSRTPAQAQNPATPWLTITKGTANATFPGDIVSCTGSFSETVTNITSGSAGNPIVITGNGSATWTSGSSDQASLTGCISITNKRYFTITGFTFQNSVNRAVIRIVGPNSAGNPAKDANPSLQVIGVTISNCTFTNNGNNGITNGATQSTIIRFQFCGRESTYTGVPGNVGAAVNFITNCTFTGNYGSDVSLTDGSTDTEVNNNTFTLTKSSQSAVNGNNFLARPIFTGGGSGRNWIHDNNLSNFTKDVYVTTNYTIQCIRADVNSKQNLVESNIIHDFDYAREGTSAVGIEYEAGSDTGIFRYNIIYRGGQYGMQDNTYNSSSNTGNQWLHNTVYDVKKAGFASFQATNSVIKNNIFFLSSSSGTFGIYFSDHSVTNGGHTLANNLYFITGRSNINQWNAPSPIPAAGGTQTLAQWKASSNEQGTVPSSDPLFVSVTNPTEDFHLQQGSPGISTGDDGFNLGAYLTQTFSSPIITNVAISNANYNSFTITWNTDISANSQINYGLTSGYGSSTTLDANLVLSHNVTVSGLTAATLYHFQIRSAQGANVTLSADFTAVTVIPRPTSVTIS